MKTYTVLTEDNEHTHTLPLPLPPPPSPSPSPSPSLSLSLSHTHTHTHTHIINSVGGSATGLTHFKVHGSSEVVKDIHKELVINSSNLRVLDTIGQGRECGHLFCVLTLIEDLVHGKMDPI